jgi:DNA polymerase I-like protein with 3'-5' exonuclease and polymerase domains
MEPVKYPDLSGETVIAFDTETKDPNLFELGPGNYRRSVDDSRLLGVSLANNRGFSEYYNLGHYDCSAAERAKNIAYLKDQLGNNVPKLGQMIMYDIDWLENGGYAIKVNGKLGSIEIAEALLNETQKEYNMEFMGKKYCGKGKASGLPEAFCEANNMKGDFRKWLWKMPYSIVREYGREDAALPIDIFNMQRPMLEEQDMLDLFDLESELVRVLVLMRKTGIRIDTEKRDRNGLMVQSMIEQGATELFSRYGEFNYNSSQQIARILDSEGIPYPLTKPELKADGTYTKGGNPAINAYFFKRYGEEIPLVGKLHKLRQARHHLDTFIMGSHVKFVGPDGLIHAQFFSTKNDNLGALKGTRSGRLSGANPNLQQQPSKGVDEFWGQLCREDFIPFDNCWWGKCDYSQIEYKFMAHFAVGPGSEELRRTYNDNPKQDYHQYIMDLTGLKRRYAKNLNFGVAFGMGKDHMAELFGWDVDYAEEVIKIYHERAPYIKATIDLVQKRARQRGYIKTFLKRRSHLIDPKKAYTMYCRLMQGSAADLLKKAMVDQYHAGVFAEDNTAMDTLHLHATVHDELDVSIPKTKLGLDAFREMQHIMETALVLKVPVRAEPEIGNNWADILPMFDSQQELQLECEAENAKRVEKGKGPLACQDVGKVWSDLYAEVT